MMDELTFGKNLGATEKTELVKIELSHAAVTTEPQRTTEEKGEMGSDPISPFSLWLLLDA
jgi:hypothetical protein